MVISGGPTVQKVTFCFLRVLHKGRERDSCSFNELEENTAESGKNARLHKQQRRKLALIINAEVQAGRAD